MRRQNEDDDDFLDETNSIPMDFDPAEDLDEPLLRTTESIEYTTYSSVPFKWVIAMAASSFLLGGLVSFAFVFPVWRFSSQEERASIVLGFWPLNSVLIMLGSKTLRDHFCAWLNHLPFQQWRLLLIPTVLVSSYIVSSLLQLTFDPLLVLILFSIGFLVPATLQELRGSTVTWADATMWLLLWMPLHLKWKIWGTFRITDLDSNWWSLVISIVLVVGWGCQRPALGIGFRWLPTWNDGMIVTTTVVVFGLILLPFSFLSGIVGIRKGFDYGFGRCFFAMIQELLGVAIPQELLFRALLLRGLTQVTYKDNLSLVISSFVNAMFSWPGGASSVLHQLYYFIYSFLTSVVYGVAFLKSEQILPGAIAHGLLNSFLLFFVTMPSNMRA